MPLNYYIFLKSNNLGNKKNWYYSLGSYLLSHIYEMHYHQHELA